MEAKTSCYSTSIAAKSPQKNANGANNATGTNRNPDKFTGHNQTDLKEILVVLLIPEDATTKHYYNELKEWLETLGGSNYIPQVGSSIKALVVQFEQKDFAPTKPTTAREDSKEVKDGEATGESHTVEIPDLTGTLLDMYKEELKKKANQWIHQHQRDMENVCRLVLGQIDDRMKAKLKGLKDQTKVHPVTNARRAIQKLLCTQQRNLDAVLTAINRSVEQRAVLAAIIIEGSDTETSNLKQVLADNYALQQNNYPPATSVEALDVVVAFKDSERSNRSRITGVTTPAKNNNNNGKQTNDSRTSNEDPSLFAQQGTETLNLSRDQQHLQKHRYNKAPHTEGLFLHAHRDISFTLVVDDFEAVRTKYPFKVNWLGKQYVRIHLRWDNGAPEVQLSMDGYVEQALKEFEHATPTKHYTGPSRANVPAYRERIQYAKIKDRAMDNTLLHALNDIASAKDNLVTTHAATICFLNYAACNPNATIIYRASNMILRVDSKTSYLVCPEARFGGYHYLGNNTDNLFNGEFLVLAKIIKNVMASAAEAEVASLFLNAREALPVLQCLIELGHPQPATLMKTDDNTAEGILNGTIKQKRSKAIDMRFYWLNDRAEQGQFNIFWEPGKHNLAVYPSKHHQGSHHRRVRPIYLYEPDSPWTIQGCIELLDPVNAQNSVNMTRA
eukprot:jgi/Psemu1/43163/gm1.43163_g